MKKLVFVPLELMEERYSKQWYVWFTEYFNYCQFKVYTILPDSGYNCVITNGQFLDIVNTNQFKAEQLKKICQLFNDGLIDGNTTFLFMDAWFPGLEMLAYIRDGLGIPFKIVGLLHAGTWDDHDFLTQKGMKIWARNLEKSWLILLDRICVATQFHKDLIINKCKDLHPNLTATALDQKIKVINFPIYQYKPLFVKKINQIVFPHRLANEKRADLIPMLESILSTLSKQSYTLLVTKNICKNKDDYYKELAKSKFVVSLALQETYGLAVLEAVLHDCYPIVPNTLSYKELYPNEFKFEIGTDDNSTICNMFAIITKIIEDELKYNWIRRDFKKQVLKWNQNSIPNIISECLDL